MSPHSPTFPLRAADASQVTPIASAPRRYLLGTVAITAVSAVWYLIWLGGGPGPAAVGYLTVPLAGSVTAVAIVRLIRAVTLDPVARRFWRTMAVALVLASAGFGLLAVAAFGDTAELPTMPIPGAVLILASFLTAMWAVGRVPLGIDSRGQRWRQWLDRSIAFLGCSTVLFTFGLAPMIDAPEPWSPQALTLIGVSFVLAVGGITKVSYVGRGPVDRVALRLVGMSGLVGAGVALLSTRGYESSVPAQAVVIPLAPVLVSLAVTRQWGSTGAKPRRSNTWLPYLAIAAVDVPLALLPGHLTWSSRLVIAAAVLVNALVAVRQYVAIRENARLLREKRASEERLRHEVTHDGLTGLANRGLFRERLAGALEADGATVLLVDLDDFKTVNDSLGHDIGDQLLIAVAETLCRQVGDQGLPVRLGGDEFAVLIEDPGVAGEAVAQRILDAFSGPMSAHHLLVHASIGIATADPGTPLDPVLRDADVAMYAAKQRGKANWVRYHGGMEQPVFAHARLGGELRRALDAGEFRVVYQPIMELGPGPARIVGVESLVRWQHPTRGLVMPGEFIAAAEGTGLIVPLGRFVLRETFRQAAAWLADFGPDVLSKVGPNVSVRQLHDPDFLDDVRSVLAETGLSPDRVVLELTESAVLRGPQVLRALHELHEMGVRLALDDFGTGESSLSLLRAFPASIVKLDKSFVDGIELGEDGSAEADTRQAVARAVQQLAGAFGLDTVAEGIENQAQADRLHALGYTLGQGYHLARPMGAEAMTRLLAAQRGLVTAA
jgi:diguanylate cyclase (GGDEF)-like protein